MNNFCFLWRLFDGLVCSPEYMKQSPKGLQSKWQTFPTCHTTLPMKRIRFVSCSAWSFLPNVCIFPNQAHYAIHASVSLWHATLSNVVVPFFSLLFCEKYIGFAWHCTCPQAQVDGKQEAFRERHPHGQRIPRWGNLDPNLFIFPIPVGFHFSYFLSVSLIPSLSHSSFEQSGLSINAIICSSSALECRSWGFRFCWPWM